MNEAVGAIELLERETRKRLRLLAIQDLTALSLLVSVGLALLAEVFLWTGVLDGRFETGIGARERLLLICLPVTATAVLLATRHILTRGARWRSNLDASTDQVDLLIDRAMDLQDRVRAAGSVIRRGGPGNLMETALVQDAASRLSNATPERIVEYRAPRLGSAVRCYTSVGSSIVVAIAVLAAIIEYRVPSRRSMDPATVAVMQTVGDDLEQSTKAIEGGIKPGTPTANLAQQQADLARALRNTTGPDGRGRSRPLGKTDALKALSEIGEKLGDRKSELENTRASEIISLAERRFQSAVSGTAPLRRAAVTGKEGRKAQPDSKLIRAKDPSTTDDQRSGEKGSPSSRTASKNESNPSGETGSPEKLTHPMEGQAREDGSSESTETGRPAEPRVGDPGASAASQQGATPSSGQSAGSSSAQGDEKVSPLAETASAPSAESTLPNLSQDLVKKAAEIRANNLTAADIEQVRKAAEGLLKDLSAKDLANLANSKEIQQTLEQLARRVDPQQMEQLARQLLSQKEIRDELQAVGKLLRENRQAKETIAGFADKAREMAEEFKKQGYKPGSPPDWMRLDSSGQGADRAGNGPASPYGQMKSNTTRVRSSDEPLKGIGQSGDVPSPRIKPGNIGGLKQEGEPIYGRPHPGSAPARVSYSTAYPGYRREAERSVQRSQVPPRLRTLIRNYFDAINPDAEKHP